jgi:hypothetical protein
VSGKELVFRRPGEDSEGEDPDPETPNTNEEPGSAETVVDSSLSLATEVASVDGPKIIIHEED